MTIPVNEILDRWHAGQSAGVIRRDLGIPHVKRVYAVIAQARSIGDPRAVVHTDDLKRPVGSFAHARAKRDASRC